MQFLPAGGGCLTLNVCFSLYTEADSRAALITNIPAKLFKLFSSWRSTTERERERERENQAAYSL